MPPLPSALSWGPPGGWGLGETLQGQGWEQQTHSVLTDEQGREGGCAISVSSSVVGYGADINMIMMTMAMMTGMLIERIPWSQPQPTKSESLRGDRTLGFNINCRRSYTCI